MNDIIINFDYNTKQPVALPDFVNALSAFNSQVNRQLKRNEFLRDKDIILEIVSIESGSLKTKIMPFIAAGVLAITHGNEVVTAIRNVTDGYSYLARERTQQPPMEKQDLEDAKNIMKPVIKEHGSTLNIVVREHGSVKIELNTSWEKANIINTQAQEEIKKLEEPHVARYEKVVLNLEEAVNKTEKGDVGDRGIIGEISGVPVKLNFKDPDAKKAILENPFRKSFVVDVDAITVQGHPTKYKILTLHSIIERSNPN